MLATTLCFLVQGEPITQVLLGLKKTGFGQGKMNGFGGKVEKNETVSEAAARELWEETKVKVSQNNLLKMGQIDLFFSANPQFNRTMYLFIVKQWDGIPCETKEMDPKWFKVGDIPYAQMWQDDFYCLPSVLKQQPISGKVIFGPDNESVINFQIHDEAVADS